MSSQLSEERVREIAREEFARMQERADKLRCLVCEAMLSPAEAPEGVCDECLRRGGGYPQS